MERIKILFFIVGAFFGIERSLIISENTSITIHPQEKTIAILQENLITISKNATDSLNVLNELETLLQQSPTWHSDLKQFRHKKKHFFISEDQQTLNSKLELSYTTVLDLNVFGITLNKDGQFSMTDFPKSHIQTKDGKLVNGYWHFNSDNPFTFSEAPLTDLPESFKKHKKAFSRFL